MSVACRDAVDAASQHQHTTHLRQHNPAETTCDTRHTQNPNPKHACATHAYKRSEAYKRVTVTFAQHSENSPFSHAHDTTNANTTQRTTHTASTQPHEAPSPHATRRTMNVPTRAHRGTNSETRATHVSSRNAKVTANTSRNTSIPQPRVTQHSQHHTPHHTNTTKHNKPHDTTNTTHETQPTQHKIIDQHSD